MEKEELREKEPEKFFNKRKKNKNGQKPTHKFGLKCKHPKSSQT